MREKKTPQHECDRAEAAADKADPTPSVETELHHPEPASNDSDVDRAESATIAAPSFRRPSDPRDPIGGGGHQRPSAPGKEARQPAKLPCNEFPRDEFARDQAPLALLPGARVDDFEVIRLLGRGAFGHVYLARQVSLDRQVALKISANKGSEGRTMARLEHQHIVQVFSETVEPDFNQRLLCMQLVPGIGLEKLIGQLHADRRDDGSPPQWRGSELLAIIDGNASLPAALDPSALHDREALARMDAVEATAWFGGRLAEALDFAHRHGVLHRDIKPANILVNPYGRPLLADFNISSKPVDSDPGGEELFGGTFAYMAPEHLDAFNPSHPAGHDAVTAQSDIFSLGLVLQQLLTGRICFPLPKKKQNILEALQTMSAERRQRRPACRRGPPSALKTLERTIARCVEPEPHDRFGSGAELAEQLDGCRRLRQAERQLPRLPRMLAPIARRPLGWLLALVVVPQLAASIVNIAYNATQIVGELTDAQQEIFAQLVIGYNILVYPVAILLFVMAVRSVWKSWRALAGTEALTDEEVEAGRRQALQLPQWIAALTMLGWFPGGILFPLQIHLRAAPLAPVLAGHFFISFYMSGLIALAYSLCGAQFVVLRALYPGMWRSTRSFGDTVRQELEPMTARLGYIQWLAGAIPLVAAILVLGLGGEASRATFRWLVTGLIVLGWIGFQFASGVIRGLSNVVAALTSTKA